MKNKTGLICYDDKHDSYVLKDEKNWFYLSGYSNEELEKYCYETVEYVPEGNQARLFLEVTNEN